MGSRRPSESNSGDQRKYDEQEVVPSTSNSATTKSTVDLGTLLECPVCLDYVLPPFHQCANGHLTCNNCLTKLNLCPECRTPLLGNIRNLALERVANLVLCSCKFQKNGCDYLMNLMMKREHEVGCEYRPYRCPNIIEPCNWEGSLEDVIPHLQKSHSEITIAPGTSVEIQFVDVHIPIEHVQCLVLSCYNRYFFINIQKREKEGEMQFFIKVTLIGSMRDAKMYKYKLEVFGQNTQLLWEGIPESIRKDTEDLSVHQNCSVINDTMVNLMAENATLNVIISISMD